MIVFKWPRMNKHGKETDAAAADPKLRTWTFGPFRGPFGF